MEFELFIEILTKFTLRHRVSYRTESIHFFSIHHRSISRGQTTMRPLWRTDHNNRLLTQDHIVFTSLYEPLSMAVAGCVFTIRKKIFRRITNGDLYDFNKDRALCSIACLYTTQINAYLLNAFYILNYIHIVTVFNLVSARM